MQCHKSFKDISLKDIRRSYTRVLGKNQFECKIIPDIIVKMIVKFCNKGTLIEEEDFCHWTEKDVEFKCLEGLDAKLKKFYSWNKAMKVEIEIDGTVFCGILYQDNNSFAPVVFGPSKRSPLPCIMLSKPKPPKRKKSTKPSSINAYSRENWPRVYIDSRNTVEQRLRCRRDVNLCNNRSSTPSKIGKENAHPRAKKLGVLVYNKRKKSRFEQKSENLAENSSRCRRSERLHDSSSKLQQINEANGYKTESNNKLSAIEFGHASPKANKNVVKSIGYKGKKCDASCKTSILPKPNLRPRRPKCRNVPEFNNLDSESNVILSSRKLRPRGAKYRNEPELINLDSNETLSSQNLRPRGAKYGNEPEFIYSDSESNETLSSHNLRSRGANYRNELEFLNLDSNETLSSHDLRPRGAKSGNVLEFMNSDSESNETSSISQYRLIDVTVRLTRYDEIQHPTDIDKIAEIKETSAHPISQYHSVINPKNKGKNKINFDSAVLSSALNVDETIKSTRMAKEELNSSKSRSRKKNKAFEKECSDLSDKFDKMTIRDLDRKGNDNKGSFFWPTYNAK